MVTGVGAAALELEAASAGAQVTIKVARIAMMIFISQSLVSVLQPVFQDIA